MGFLQKLKRKLFKKKYSIGFTPPQYSNMELGNLIFGNSRGECSIDREKFQLLFEAFFERNDFDNYGHYYSKPEEYYDETDNSSYKNEVFIIRPYYWGNDETISRLPNFYYIPTGLEISWYKYALRDAYSNQPLTEEGLIEILDHCERSMK